jgi:hypothetical protein
MQGGERGGEKDMYIVNNLLAFAPAHADGKCRRNRRRTYSGGL